PGIIEHQRKSLGYIHGRPAADADDAVRFHPAVVTNLPHEGVYIAGFRFIIDIDQQFQIIALQGQPAFEGFADKDIVENKNKIGIRSYPMRLDDIAQLIERTSAKHYIRYNTE